MNEAASAAVLTLAWFAFFATGSGFFLFVLAYTVGVAYLASKGGSDGES